MNSDEVGAPVGSLRWQAKLVGTMVVAGAIALCPAWWAVALWWEVRDMVKRGSVKV